MQREYSDDDLLAYLDDLLPAEGAAEIEKRLRSSEHAALRTRLEVLTRSRDTGTHTIGEIWKRHHASCPSREDLGRYILEAMSDDESKFVEIHLQVTQCEVCQSNLDDLLQSTNQANAAAVATRRTKYFQSSVGRVKKP